MRVKSSVFMNAPSHMLPVFAVILLEMTVAIAKMGTIGKSTI